MSFVDIKTLPPDRSLNETSFDVNREKNSNPISTRRNRSNIDNFTYHSRKVRKICFSFISSSKIGIWIFGIFLCISMVIGILTVYFTSPRPPDRTCSFITISAARNFITDDSHPHSIGVGDFNNDSLLDIVVSNSGTNKIGVFLRNNKTTFKDQLTYSTGPLSIPYAVAVADFNNDQRLDVVVANFGTNNVGLFLGIGNGTFKTQIKFSTGSSRPRWIAANDFNNDTHIDIVVVNYGTNDIGIFLGDRTGSFVNWTTFSTGFDSTPYSLAIADLNHDYHLDIVVTNFGINSMGIFLGKGNGSFTSQTIFYLDANSHPDSLALADLNNDTHIDIIVACSNMNTVSVLLGFGNGLFSLPTIYSTGKSSSPRFVITGDFDNDTKIDIAVALYNTSSVSVFFGLENGTFLDQTIFYTSYDSHPYLIANGDFNSDTSLDIAVVNYDYNYVDIILTYRNYSFLNQTTYFMTGDYSHPSALAVGDLNNDSWLDIVVTNDVNNNIEVFLGNGHGGLLSQGIYSSADTSIPVAVALGDFNNDTQLDIVVANFNSCSIDIFIGYGDGIFLNYSSYYTNDNIKPTAIAVGDLNNDSWLDIVVVSTYSNEINIFFNDGSGRFPNQSVYATDSDFNLLWTSIADFDNDNRSDIVVISGDTGNVGIFYGDSVDIFLYEVVFSVGTGALPNNAAIGDLNNDGKMDLVLNIFYNRGFQVLLGSDNETFVSKATYSVGGSSRPSWSTIADWNNDQRLDIIVSSCTTNDIVVFTGYGDGTFLQTRRYSTGSQSCPQASSSGDFNNDKLLDFVVIENSISIIGVFLANTYMNGIREATYGTGSAPHPQAIGLGHFNNDVHLDVVIANYGLGNVGFLEGYTNEYFPSQTMLSTGTLSFPTSIAICNLNNDSQLDIIVANSLAGNVGLFFGYGNGSFTSQRTYSAGLNSFPQSVTSGDFNNDKKFDIAVVYSGSNSVSIILRYDTVVLSKQKEYFIGHNSYPHAVAVGNFNNDSYYDFVVVNRGDASISVFLSLGNGSFIDPITYRAGEKSASYAILVADFNNDGCLDTVISLYHTNAVSIFLGSCNGTFSNPTNSLIGGVCNPIGIATGDFNSDGRMDLVTTCDHFNTICIFIGNGNGTLSNVLKYPTGTNGGSSYAVVADFNNDNHLDIISTHWNDIITVFQGYGNGTFFNAGKYPTGLNSNPRRIATADLNKDGNMDVVVGNTGSSNICVFFGYGTNSFSTPIFYSIERGSLSYGLVIRDFNNDHQLDIAVANYGSNDMAILFGLVNGTFFNPLTYSTGAYSQPSDLAVADFNNDNRLDIVVTNSGIDTVNVFLGDLNDDFLIGPLYSIESSSQLTSITAGDFNNDTMLDIVVADNATNNIIIVFGSGYGTFTRKVSYSTGSNSHPCSVAVADLNNDNRLDIVVANAGTNNIGVFLANSNYTFLDQMVYFTGARSLPWSVAILDFDHDTQLDIAVANYGGNSVSVFFGHGNGSFSNQLVFDNGFGSHPFALAVGDVNNDNLTDIVATNNGFGNINILMKTC